MMLPNDKISVPVSSGWVNATVVASVVYNADGPIIQTLLLLLPNSPYFQVAIYNPDEGMVRAELSERIENIVPAVEQYQQWGGDY